MQAFLADSARNRRAAEDNQGSEFGAEASSPSRPGESAYQHRPVSGEGPLSSVERLIVLFSEVANRNFGFVSSSRRLQMYYSWEGGLPSCPYVHSFQRIHYQRLHCSVIVIARI